MPKKPYYITTAIAYTSGKPHIGNTYEVVLADSIARYKRFVGYDVRFQTGTDEHGQKIEIKAFETLNTPKEFVDEVSTEIKGIWDLMNTSYDKFIRTTDEYHEKQVQKIFKKLYEQGDIYKSEYEGMYCTPCESFFTSSQLVDGKCPDCGRECQTAKEEAYFFKLSKYADRLIEHINTHPEFIQPESRKNEMMNNFLLPGLQDLCVSRTSFKWGIPVDFDPGHVVYVWIDALSNYITGLDYDVDGASGELYRRYWPADLHLIGKDILRFHTIYWPIMLMALGEPLPKHIYAHGWMLFGQDKMSKSRGNVIYADDLVKLFGVDATRFYSLSEMPFAQDGSITYEAFISRYNSELANTLGNLVNRTIAMSNKYFDGIVLNKNVVEDVDNDLVNTAKNVVTNYNTKMNELKVQDAINEIWELVHRSNKYIDETMPWSLAKEEEKLDRLNTVLYNLIEAIRMIAVMIAPIMPETSEKIFALINSDEKSLESINEFGKYISGTKVETAKPLFERIDEAKKLEEIENMKEVENKVEEKIIEEEKVNLITIDELDKVKLNVGKILEAKRVEGANKLYCLSVDMGTEVRTIVSGLVPYYTEEQLLNKLVVVVTNLKPAKLRGIESNGMLLAAGDGDIVKLITVDGEVDLGSSIH